MAAVTLEEARQVVHDGLELLERVTTIILSPSPDELTFRVMREDEAVVDQFDITITRRDGHRRRT